jgi:hypothetical protein
MAKISGTRPKTSSSKVSQTKPKPKAKVKAETAAPKKNTGWAPASNTGGSESGRSTVSNYTPPSFSSSGGE